MKLTCLTLAALMFAATANAEVPCKKPASKPVKSKVAKQKAKPVEILIGEKAQCAVEEKAQESAGSGAGGAVSGGGGMTAPIGPMRVFYSEEYTSLVSDIRPSESNGQPFAFSYGSFNSTMSVYWGGSTNGIVVHTPAVPEPATYALFLSGAAMIVMLQRRRSKR